MTKQYAYSTAMAQVWINGTFVEDSQASVSLRDTGLLHAAGVFTTMRSYGGKIFRLAQHLQRLRDSCEALFIPLQHDDAVLAAASAELLNRNNLTDARLRLTITRGMSQQDPVHGTRLEPTAFLTASAIEPYPAEYYERGMTVTVVDEQKLNPYDIQAGHKTLNYFSRLASLREANRRSAAEALWFNVHNYLQSGSISNVFLAKAGTLFTPPTAADMQEKSVADAIPYPRSAVLPGVTRQAVLAAAAAASIRVQRKGFTINDLLEADEVFLTNSIMNVMPVCRIERRAIGSDKPGPITRQLADAIATMIAAMA
jgi:branched-chain amino acid aminotransferase